MSAELIPLALVVALSPVSVLPALLLVLYSTRPRVAGVSFAAGWVVGLAGSMTALPVLAHVVAAKRLDHLLDRLRSWIQRRQAEISAVALVVIGAVLILTAVGD
ncbi:GAP family protein [Mycolicibacterium sarraceniae]|uniref:GAP family protein n=1 Tax=Mycolicibacterium sarraceniae TaxID=1534348 RepID=A0A7I7SN78_9MYCO|nr:GAP family protein [Mycolicibacterium sarraceniae]BBY57881.1 hypothetical protein MSAR_10170 [Mycolicibacterium sarraceniae]